jgi:hypothetical protein
VKTFPPWKWKAGNDMQVFDFRHRPIFDNFEGGDRKFEIVKNPSTIGIVFLFSKFVLDRSLQKLQTFIGLAYLGDSGYSKML